MYRQMGSRYTAPEKKNEVHCYEGGENCQSKVSQSQGAFAPVGWFWVSRFPPKGRLNMVLWLVGWVLVGVFPHLSGEGC